MIVCFCGGRKSKLFSTGALCVSRSIVVFYSVGKKEDKFLHTSILFLSNGCVIVGYNDHLRHAEDNALRKFYHLARKFGKVIKIDYLFSGRTDKMGNVKMGKPCPNCSRLIAKSKIVQRVVYSGEDGRYHWY